MMKGHGKEAKKAKRCKKSDDNKNDKEDKCFKKANWRTGSKLQRVSKTSKM